MMATGLVICLNAITRPSTRPTRAAGSASSVRPRNQVAAPVATAVPSSTAVRTMTSSTVIRPVWAEVAVGP
jgi:hypothetical protein